MELIQFGNIVIVVSLFCWGNLGDVCVLNLLLNAFKCNVKKINWFNNIYYYVELFIYQLPTLAYRQDFD